MERRRFIRGAGLALVSASVLSNPVAAGPTDGDRPNDNVPHQRVHPFSTRADPIVVPAGTWLDHKVGWVDNSKEKVERFLEVVDFDAWIDGEHVTDEWGPIQEEDGRLFTWWNYSTPPKSPGNYTFRTRFEFTADLDERWQEGDVVDLTGHYRVEAGGHGGP